MRTVIGGPGVACSITRIRRLEAGELAGDERARTEAHLAGCARCQASARELTREQEALAAALPFERFAAGVADGLARPEAPRHPSRRRALRVGMALAAVLVAAAALPLLLRVVPRPEEQGWRAKGALELTLWASEDGRVRRSRRASRCRPGASLRVGLPTAGRAHGAVALVGPGRHRDPLLRFGDPRRGGRVVRVDGVRRWLARRRTRRSPGGSGRAARAAGGGRRGRGGRCGRRGDRPAARARGPVIRAIAAAALVALASRAGAAEPRRFALVAGAPDGGRDGEAPLRRARCPPHARDPDARRRGPSGGRAAAPLRRRGRPRARARGALRARRRGSRPRRAHRAPRLLLRPREGRRPPARERPGAVRGAPRRARGRPRRRPRRARRLLPLGRDRARERRPARTRLRGVRGGGGAARARPHRVVRRGRGLAGVGRHRRELVHAPPRLGPPRRRRRLRRRDA